MKRNLPGTYLSNLHVICILSYFLFMAISKFGILLTTENLHSRTDHKLYLLIPTLECIIALALVIPRRRLKAMIAAATILLLWVLCNGYRVATGSSLPFVYGGLHESFSWMEHFCIAVPMLLLSCMSITLFLINSFHESRSSRIPV